MDSIFYDTQQELGPPTERGMAPVDSLFYETLQDMGPLPTKWRMDLDELVVEPVTAPTPIPYPVIHFDRTPARPSVLDRLTEVPMQVWWAVMALAVMAIVACGWMLLP